jgi:predicted TIM-barrel fold metal-dependent hydrolase
MRNGCHSTRNRRGRCSVHRRAPSTPIATYSAPVRAFPYAPERRYTPCDAPKEKLWALRDYLGFERNVLVQATCHGTDNRALVDALHDAEGRARGVATVGGDVSDAELRALDAAGVRGCASISSGGWST